MSDQVLIAVISTLGSIIVAYITATANAKKADKDEVRDLEKLRKENAKLKEKIKSRGNKKNGNK